MHAVCTDSVAQLVEQQTLNLWVEGSSPSGVTVCVERCRSVSFGTFFVSFVCVGKVGRGVRKT